MREYFFKLILDISLKMAQTRQIEPLLEYAMQAAMDLVGAEYGYLILSQPDGGLDFRVSLDAQGKAIVDPKTQISQSIIKDVLDTNEPLVILDAQEYETLSDASSVSILALRSVMCVPLQTHSQTLGVLYVENRSEASIFEDQDVEPLILFAAQAAVMIENGLLLNTLEQRVADRTLELAAYFDLTMLASETRSLDDLLSPAVVRIAEVGRCDVVCVHLSSDDHLIMSMLAHINLPEAECSQLQEIPLQGNFGRWIKGIHNPIIHSQSRPEKILPSVLQLPDYPSYLIAPIHAQDQPLGILSCYRKSEKGYALDEISLLTALAKQMGIMLENHRLRKRIEEIAITEERQRLARELHDSITQSLYSQTLFARTAQYAREDGDQTRLIDSLVQIEENSLDTLKEMRLLLFHLQPLAIKDLGFAEAINTRLEMVERRFDIQAVCEVDESLYLPAEIEEMLFRVALEALNNSLKHARAGQVRVQLKAIEAGIFLEVNDDGCGFDTNEEWVGMGLKIMQERVGLSGGELVIHSRPDKGTVVRVTIKHTGTKGEPST